MSDSVLRLIPVAPTFVPSASARHAAEDLLRRLVPLADDVSSQVTDDVRFVDCGVNFETVTCPLCGVDVGEWWTLVMEVAHEQRFVDLRISTPCCTRWTNLNELNYSGAMGFARFRLEAVNPEVVELPRGTLSALEQIVGCGLRALWART